eukprot:6490453-Amphidinium_carterae.1
MGMTAKGPASCGVVSTIVSAYFPPADVMNELVDSVIDAARDMAGVIEQGPSAIQHGKGGPDLSVLDDVGCVKDQGNVPSPRTNTLGSKRSKHGKPGDIFASFRALSYNARTMGDPGQATAYSRTPASALAGTGQFAHLLKQLSLRTVHVAAIQETRIKLDFEETQSHWFITSPPDNGHGGMAVVLAKDEGIEVLAHKIVSPRVMWVRITFLGKRLSIVNLHGPTTKHSLSVHLEFQAQVFDVLNSLPTCETIVLGDLNLRVGEFREEFPGCIGNFVSFGDAHSSYGHWHSLVHSLNSRGFAFLNTMFAPLQGCTVETWTHPSCRSMQQIDFVLCAHSLLRYVAHCSTLEWGVFDSVATSDHAPVMATWVLCGASAPRPAPVLRKVRDDDHLARFKAELARISTPLHGQSAGEQVQELQFRAAQALTSTAVKKRVRKSDWISDDCWKLMEILHAFRKLLRQWRYGQVSSHGMVQFVRELPATWFPTGSMFLRHVFLSEPSVALNEADEGVLREMIQCAEFQASPLEAYLLRVVAHGSKMVKKQLRRCKWEWHHDKVAKVEANVAGRQSREAFALVKSLVKVKHRRSPHLALEQPDGSVSSDRDVVSAGWKAHWQSHLGAACSFEAGFQDFIVDECYKGGRIKGMDLQSPVHVPDHMLFTVEQVQDVLDGLHKHKSAPDTLHYSLWCHVPQLTECMCRHFNEILCLQSVPKAFNGSITVPVLKRGKVAWSTSSYRPVQLMLAEAKVFAKLVLMQLKSVLMANFSQHQFALGHAPASDFPHAIVCQLQSLAQHSGHSLGFIYVDVEAAFDSILRELLIEPMQPRQHTIDALVRKGLSAEDAERTLSYVKDHPLALCNQSLPPHLSRVLTQWLHNSWVQMPDQPMLHAVPPCQRRDLDRHETLTPLAGVKQGDNLAGILFASYMQVVLDELHEFIKSHPCGVGFALPHPKWRTLDKDASPANPAIARRRRDRGHSERRPEALECDTTATTHISHVCFADDVLIPLRASSPEVLVQVAIQVLHFVVSLFKRFGLRVNCNCGKTEVAFHLRGPTARPLWQRIKDDCRRDQEVVTTQAGDKDEASVLHDKPLTNPMFLRLMSGQHVGICHRYVYLGKSTSVTGDHSHEIQVRIGTATSHFNCHRSVLTCSALSIPTRLHVFQVKVRIHLTQNLHTCPKMLPKTVLKLQHAYVGMLRQMVRLLPDNCGVKGAGNKIDGVGLVNDEVLLRALALPSMHNILIYLRLVFFQRVVVANSEVLRASIAIIHPGSLWDLWMADLLSLSKLVELSHMPPVTWSTISDWIRLAVLSGPDWKRMLKRAFLPLCKFDFETFRTLTASAAPRCEVVEIGPDADSAIGSDGNAGGEELTWKCPVCPMAFSNHTALSAHKRRLHRIHPPLAIRLKTTHCPICLAHLGTRIRVLKHLQDRPACGLLLLQQEPIPVEEYERNVGAWNKLNTLHTRSCIPRTGPIPCIGGVPVSQSVQPSLVDLYCEQV